MPVTLKFIEPTVELVTEPDLVRKVELAYRICYKSEDKVSETSKSLVQRLSNSRKPNRHTSPLEHSRIIVHVYPQYLEKTLNIIHSAFDCQLFKFFTIDIDQHAIIGNFRAFHDLMIELTKEDKLGNWMSDYSIIREFGNDLHDKFPEVFPKIGPCPYGDEQSTWMTTDNPPCSTIIAGIKEDTHYKTFRIVTSRDILQELVRHRTMSFSVESTRYCNYEKKGYTFCIPRPYDWAENVHWDANNLMDATVNHLEYDSDQVMVHNAYGEGVGIRYDRLGSIATISKERSMLDVFLANCQLTAERYNKCVSVGVPPQEARMLLPGALKTELYMTGTDKQWNHFLVLRNTQEAHPQIRYLAEQIQKVFE